MEIIATRTFSSTENGTQYEVLIAKPVQVDREEWRCDVEIRGPHGAKKGSIYGIDALQALMLSFENVRAQLNNIKPPVFWLDLPVDLAFPRTIPNMLGDDFYRRVEAYIDAEIDRHNEPYEKG